MHKVDNEPIEEGDNVHIDDVMEVKGRFKYGWQSISDLEEIYATETCWCDTSPLEQSNTSKGNNISMCKRISSDYSISILPLHLDVQGRP